MRALYFVAPTNLAGGINAGHRSENVFILQVVHIPFNVIPPISAGSSGALCEIHFFIWIRVDELCLSRY